MEPMLLVGGETVDVTLDVQQDGSDLVEAVPVVQYYAVRKDVPGTPSLFSGSATNSRSKYSATLTSSSNMYARIGVATRLTSGSAAQGPWYESPVPLPADEVWPDPIDPHPPDLERGPIVGEV
jgi:hypothetical protein